MIYELIRSVNEKLRSQGARVGGAATLRRVFARFIKLRGHIQFEARSADGVRRWAPS